MDMNKYVRDLSLEEINAYQMEDFNQYNSLFIRAGSKTTLSILHQEMEMTDYTMRPTIPRFVSNVCTQQTTTAVLTTQSQQSHKENIQATSERQDLFFSR